MADTKNQVGKGRRLVSAAALSLITLGTAAGVVAAGAPAASAASPAGDAMYKITSTVGGTAGDAFMKISVAPTSVGNYTHK